MVVAARGNIHAVIFDLGGVAFRYRPELRLEGFAAHTGDSPLAIRKRLMDSGYAKSCDSGRLQGDAAYREGIRMLGHRITLERFRDLWVSAFDPDDAIIALARKTKRHAAVALMTNNSALVRDGLELRYAEAMGVFRPALFSSDVGVMKPDPRIFAAMIDLLGVEAHEALFIDDAAENVAVAASLGFAVHHFRCAQTLRADLSALDLLR